MAVRKCGCVEGGCRSHPPASLSPDWRWNRDWLLLNRGNVFTKGAVPKEGCSHTGKHANIRLWHANYGEAHGESGAITVMEARPCMSMVMANLEVTRNRWLSRFRMGSTFAFVPVQGSP